MTTVGHVMILASAGSGKTYALTNRFVRLLALGAKPERIVALTFTRKAAGEFFDEILNKLARAARDGEFAEQLARDIEVPALGPADFLKMLRNVVDAYRRIFGRVEDPYFRDRIADVEDVGRRVMEQLLGERHKTAPLEEGAIIVTDNILPSHFARLELDKVAAIVSEHGGPTSHGAIFARAPS